MVQAKSGSERMQLMRLHTDENGIVWYGDDATLAGNSHMRVDRFVESDLFRADLLTSHVIRMLGNRDNARLLVTLRDMHKKLDRKPPLMQVCCPAIVATASLRRVPYHVLHSMWQPAYTARRHGMWHDMTASDHCTYAIVNALTEVKADEAVPDVVKKMARFHPAWSALSFVNGYQADHACRLLADIIDPRWYFHPFRPHRLSRLYQHLGLTPENMSHYLGQGAPGRYYERACNAVRAWYGPERPVCDGNGCFLWKSFVEEPNAIKGLLRATQRLVSFIHAVWSSAVSTDHPEVQFVASTFFKNDVEASAFSRHAMAKNV